MEVQEMRVWDEDLSWKSTGSPECREVLISGIFHTGVSGIFFAALGHGVRV